MNESTSALRRAHRLLQVGIFLFFLATLVGLAVPHFAVPRLGLSTHLLGIVQGIFLVVIGLLWPKLTLGPRTAHLLFWLLIYGCFAAFTANLLAGVWGAGNSMLPIAAGSARGTPLQEGIIVVSLRSAAVSLIAALLMTLWGLRAAGLERTSK